jgi:hypothetical protein
MASMGFFAVELCTELQRQRTRAEKFCTKHSDLAQKASNGMMPPTRSWPQQQQHARERLQKYGNGLLLANGASGFAIRQRCSCQHLRFWWRVSAGYLTLKWPHDFHMAFTSNDLFSQQVMISFPPVPVGVGRFDLFPENHWSYDGSGGPDLRIEYSVTLRQKSARSGGSNLVMTLSRDRLAHDSDLELESKTVSFVKPTR